MIYKISEGLFLFNQTMMDSSPNRDNRLFSVVSCRAQIVLCCAMGFAVFSYDSALYGAFMINGRFLNDFWPTYISISQIFSTFSGGSFLGALALCFAGDISRRLVIICGCVVTIIGIILQASSFSMAQLLVGRVVGGIGNGAVTAAIPVWLVETQFGPNRGQSFAIMLGTASFASVIVAWINYGVRYTVTTFSWRFPIALQGIFAVACMLSCLWLPESPRWLISRERVAEGEHVISLLLGKTGIDGQVQTLRHEIEAANFHEKAVSCRGKDFNRIMLGSLPQIFQQLSGLTILTYYMVFLTWNIPLLYQFETLLVAAGNCMNLFVFTLIGALLVDRVKRVNLMLCGWILQGLSFVAILVCFVVFTWEATMAILAFFYLYITVYGLTTITLPWLYPVEVNSQRRRLLGSAAATALGWMFSYIFVSVSTLGFIDISWRYCIVFVVLNFVAAVAARVCCVETSGLSLEEMNRHFDQGRDYSPPERVFGKTQADSRAQEV